MPPNNDLTLSECLTGIEKLRNQASKALNTGDDQDAFIAFMLIETMATKAMQRLNALKYDKPLGEKL